MRRVEGAAGGLYAWQAEDSRDPFHILRRLLLDEILEEDEVYSWLNYVEEHHGTDKEKNADGKEPKKRSHHSDTESEDEGEHADIKNAINNLGGLPNNSAISPAPTSITGWHLPEAQGSSRRLRVSSTLPRGICRGGTIYIPNRTREDHSSAGSAFASWDSATAFEGEDEEELGGAAGQGQRFGRLRRQGVREIGGKIRHAWLRQWRGKGTDNRFYIPRITRDRANNLRVVWEDEDEEYDEHLQEREENRQQRRGNGGNQDA